LSDAAGYLLYPLAGLLYGGSLAFWPLYRLLRRQRPRLRSLAVTFAVHVILVLGWTVLEVRWAQRGGDWLHGLTIYIVINLVFLFVYLLLLFLERSRHVESRLDTGG